MANFNPSGNPHPHFGKGKHKVNPDAVNHELRRKLWDGQLPIKVTLYDKEITKINRKVRCLYMMAPRLNYLTFILDNVKQCFDDFVMQESVDSFSTMYFEYNDKPLKWDVPIGV